MPRPRMSLGEAAAFIDSNYKSSIAILAKISSQLNSEFTRTGKSKKYYEQLDDFLSWLQNDVSMSPQLRKRSKIVLALEDIYAKPNYHFPDVYMKKARQLFERWEASGWKDEHEGTELMRTRPTSSRLAYPDNMTAELFQRERYVSCP